MPKVSVIIPVYNEESVIAECLQSLLKQSYKNLEIICVDDGSIDRTSQMLRTASSTHKNIKLLYAKHKGAGAARNLGAGKAKGEILVFVDADMIFDKNFLKELIKPIINGKTIGTFSIQEFLANKNNAWAVCWNINRNLPKDRMHAGSPKTSNVFRAILKKEFNKAGGFDEGAGYTDDWSLSERLRKLAVATKAKFYHKNPDSLREVFIQSKWMGKRKYKFGILGDLFALARASLPVSIMIGLVKAIINLRLEFIVFKIISDFGQFLGIMEYKFLDKAYK